MGSLTEVSIDFETSHLVFPIVIACILAALSIAILITKRRRIAQAGTYWRGIVGRMDKVRFLGTLLLTLVYFSLMVPIGNLWPNTGSGFLICSIPFVLANGLLFMHERSPRSVAPVVVVSIVAPVLVWWLFTDIFFLTLP